MSEKKTKRICGKQKAIPNRQKIILNDFYKTRKMLVNASIVQLFLTICWAAKIVSFKYV